MVKDLGVAGNFDADDHIDAFDGGALGGIRQIGEVHVFLGDIHKLAGIFEKEMMVVGGVGIEIGPPRIDNDLAQEIR